MDAAGGAGSAAALAGAASGIRAAGTTGSGDAWNGAAGNTRVGRDAADRADAHDVTIWAMAPRRVRTVPGAGSGR